MKTYMTIFIPQLDILKTICRDIEKIDLENHFTIGTQKHYRVTPFCYSSSGNIITALTDSQLKRLNTYQSNITTDTEIISHILENDFDIIFQNDNMIAAIITYNGDCDNYIGEDVAINKMVEYLEKLKDICLKSKH